MNSLLESVPSSQRRPQISGPNSLFKLTEAVNAETGDTAFA
jgi:hypothetical protein